MNAVPAPFLPPWLSVAIKELGVKEIGGSQHNQRVLEYHQSTSLRASDDETPWCSAFANWCMRQAGVKGTGAANARSWMTWGNRLTTPAYGCVVVLKRGKQEWQGHVGFLVFEGRDKIMVLGGNQGNAVSVAAFNKADVLAYRWA